MGGGNRRCSQLFPKARAGTAPPEGLFSHPLKIAPISAMPPCQGLSAPLNESPSTASHKTRPSSSSVYPPKSEARPWSARHRDVCQLNTCCFIPGMERLGVRKTGIESERARLRLAGLPPPRPPLSAQDLGLQPANAGPDWHLQGGSPVLRSPGLRGPQTPPPSNLQPRKCHNCRAEGSTFSAAQGAPFLHAIWDTPLRF